MMKHSFDLWERLRGTSGVASWEHDWHNFTSELDGS